MQLSIECSFVDVQQSIKGVPRDELYSLLPLESWNKCKDDVPMWLYKRHRYSSELKIIVAWQIGKSVVKIGESLGVTSGRSVFNETCSEVGGF
jgi:hypothetical protein